MAKTMTLSARCRTVGRNSISLTNTAHSQLDRKDNETTDKDEPCADKDDMLEMLRHLLDEDEILTIGFVIRTGRSASELAEAFEISAADPQRLYDGAMEKICRVASKRVLRMILQHALFA